MPLAAAPTPPPPASPDNVAIGHCAISKPSCSRKCPQAARKHLIKLFSMSQSNQDIDLVTSPLKACSRPQQPPQYIRHPGKQCRCACALSSVRTNSLG